MRKLFLIMLVLICPVLGVGLGQSKSPTPAPSRGAVPAKFTLTIDPGLVLRSGDVRRLPRQEFFILSRNLADAGDVTQIAFEYGVQAYVNAVTGGPALVFPDL